MKSARLSLIIGASVLAVGGAATLQLHAADHKDGPSVTADPAADITDVYAWMSPDKSKVNLVMDVYPNAPAGSMMSDQVLYVFHLSSAAGYGMAATETNVICGFDTTGKVTCWVGNSEVVTGDASATAGITSTSGKTTVFTGLRDDPFFFNLTGFKATAAAVVAAGSLPLDGAGCPTLDAPTADGLVTQLHSNATGGAAANDFAGQNVQSIVIQVDTALVTPGGKILGVWGSTNRRG
jgi:hypothetical protein